MCSTAEARENRKRFFDSSTTRTMDNKLSSLAKRINGLPQIEGEETCAAHRAHEALIEITGFLAED